MNLLQRSLCSSRRLPGRGLASACLRVASEPSRLHSPTAEAARSFDVPARCGLSLRLQARGRTRSPFDSARTRRTLCAPLPPKEPEHPSHPTRRALLVAVRRSVRPPSLPHCAALFPAVSRGPEELPASRLTAWLADDDPCKGAAGCALHSGSLRSRRAGCRSTRALSASFADASRLPWSGLSRVRDPRCTPLTRAPRGWPKPSPGHATSAETAHLPSAHLVPAEAGPKRASSWRASRSKLRSAPAEAFTSPCFSRGDSSRVRSHSRSRARSHPSEPVR